MQLILPPEIENALEAHARQQKTTPERLALDALRARFLTSVPEDVEIQDGSLADFLSDVIGSIHSSEVTPGGAQMSDHSDQKFAQGMREKRKKGNL